MIRKQTLAAVLVLPLALLAGMLAGCAEPAETPSAAKGVTDQRQVDALVKSYLELRRLLAEDRHQEVPGQLAEVRRAAQPLTDSENAQVKARAEAIAEMAKVRPDNLKEARAAFKGISAALIELVKEAPPSNRAAEALHVGYCPMARASWLQTTRELSNPYMGKEMPRCGEIQQTIEPRPAFE